MKTIKFIHCCLLLGAIALTTAACKKEYPEIDAEAEIKNIVITDLGNGDKKLDFAVVVTQFGNTFYRDYKMSFTKYNSTVVLDSFQTMLPSAREFVNHTIQPVQSGTYEATVTLVTEGSSKISGLLIEVP